MKIFSLMLTMAIFLVSKHLFAQEQSEVDKSQSASHEISDTAPNLADLIPLTTKFLNRSAAIANELTGIKDISEIENQLEGIASKLRGHANNLKHLKDSKFQNYSSVIINKTLQLNKTDTFFQELEIKIISLYQI